MPYLHSKQLVWNVYASTYEHPVYKNINETSMHRHSHTGHLNTDMNKCKFDICQSIPDLVHVLYQVGYITKHAHIW